MNREQIVWLLGAAWLAAVAGGFWLWERVHGAPGGVGQSAVAADSSAVGRWRLTVFAHPHCPCTRTSLHEAEELKAELPELAVRVLFVRPPEATDGWERGDSWDAAARIPGAEVGCDADGAEARRFGAETSGQAVLTDPAGRVVFRGGITRGRAHAGDGPGQRAIRDWLSGRTGAANAPVYGCPLLTPAD